PSNSNIRSHSGNAARNRWRFAASSASPVSKDRRTDGPCYASYHALRQADHERSFPCAPQMINKHTRTQISGGRNETTMSNQIPSGRRRFLRSSAAGLVTGAIAITRPLPGIPLVQRDAVPGRSARNGRRLLFKGGIVLSMDRNIGDFEKADVLIEGKKIAAVGPSLK